MSLLDDFLRECESAANPAKSANPSQGLARLARLAGHRWQEIANEDHGDDALLAELPDETLRVYAAVCADRLLREQGIVPASHTQQANCPKCGPVLVLPGCDTSRGCPWCAVRHSMRAKRAS